MTTASTQPDVRPRLLAPPGRREEALTATTEAVEIHRRLAAADRAAFGPTLLATSLHNLSADLSSLGRGEEALTATSEAVEIYRQLAAASPAAFEPDLTTSLHNLAAVLRTLGREQEAASAAEEAAGRPHHPRA